MDRIPKFRGQVPKEAQENFFKENFVYGSVIYCEDDIYSRIMNDEFEVDVLTDTVSQFTGSLDVNGVEIYEDDIVECHGKTCTVIWMEERCGFYLRFDGFSRDIINREPFQSVYKMNAFKKKVIGKVHG